MRKYKKFTEYEDEIIKRNAENSSNNLRESFRASAFILKRNWKDIQYRYYEIRLECEPLFVMVDNRKNVIEINSKVSGGLTRNKHRTVNSTEAIIRNFTINVKKNIPNLSS
jgi:hypothetical protein